MLTINNLKKSFGETQVLKGIDLTVDKGEVVAIIGPSGSGKTTLLRCISFLETSDEGHMELAGKSFDMKKVDKKQIKEARMSMGFVFQSFNLFNNKTAIENVMEGLTIARKMDKKTAYDRAEEMLTKVGMIDRKNYYPSELSGGQKQRVAIARAIAPSPDIILLDEPTSALDPELVGEVLEVMTRLAGEGTTMVVVTHQMGFARNAATNVVFMDNGLVVESGKPQELFINPKEERTKQFIGKFNE